MGKRTSLIGGKESTCNAGHTRSIPGLGIKKSSAQITDHYKPEDLIGRQILAVVNFPPRQIADFMSEVLVLGTYSEGGVVLIKPDMPVKDGDKLG